MAQGRTDLALEAAADAESGSLQGVETRETAVAGWPVTEVHILNDHGARALGKPVGRYLTIDLTDYRSGGTDAFPRAVDALGECLGKLVPRGGKQALVVGLGNRGVTPDAVGPRCADHVLVTRHLTQRDPVQFRDFFPVAALAAGVLGTTGVESGELVAAVAGRIRPDFVLAVDALAARSVRRLCTTVQIADTGIVPGSGVGNARAGLNRDTLGVPVIALGVPTVVDGATLAHDFGDGEAGDLEGVLVTPKDVDALVAELGKLVGYGINRCLQPGLSVQDMDYFLS